MVNQIKKILEIDVGWSLGDHLSIITQKSKVKRQKAKGKIARQNPKVKFLVQILDIST